MKGMKEKGCGRNGTCRPGSKGYALDHAVPDVFATLCYGGSKLPPGPDLALYAY